MNRPLPSPREVLFVGAAVTALIGGTHALAATASSADTNAQAVTEVVVTAQRREQKLQDVGIAVAVVGKKELQELNVTNATDLVRAIPNLKYNAYASSQVVFNVRGVSQNDYGDQQEPPVAVYQDDSYSSSITTASFPIFDLARTEALRGPQGTLFGRNATGGAIQFISNQPTQDFGGYLTGTYGSYNKTIIEGALSGPLTQGLTARIAGQFDRDDGYIKNIAPGQPNRGADNHWALRGILAWEPTSQFKAKLTLRYSEADHERQASMYALSPSCPNANYQGVNLPANQVCGYWSAYNGGVPGSMATGFYNRSVIAWQGGDPWAIDATGDPYVDRKIFGSTFRVDAKAGAFDITSITDYQYLDKFYTEAGDGQPEFPYVPGQATYTDGPCPAPSQSITCYAPGTIFYQKDHTNQYSEELRFTTRIGRNYLVFGAFGMIIDGNFRAKYATPFDEYDPLVVFSQRTESFAFFAQDEYKLTDKLKFIGGLRFWHDHKIGDYTGSEYFSGFTMHYGPDGISYNDPTGTTPLTGVTATPANAHPSFSDVTARAELDYKPSDRTLLYVSYNRGSKSGGFTFSTGTPTLGQAVIDTLNGIAYGPETLNDFEVGLKATLAPGTTLNLAGYYYDYQNYQAFVQVGYTQAVRNLPAKAGGFEAEFASHPMRGLTLQVSGSLESSRVNNILLPDGVTVVSHSLPQAPGFTGAALARYEFGLAGGMASIQGDMQWQTHSCFTVLCAPVENEPGYTIENARISFTPRNRRYDIAFYVNNIFNKAYRAYAYDGSLYFGSTESVYAKPRTWGLTATVHFGGQ
jgi:iron complex outermembrane recepter protein